MVKPFIFKPCAIKPWFGKYSRAQGKSASFRIKKNPERKEFWPLIKWNYLGETLTCPALGNSQSIYDLTEAVNKAKKYMSPKRGGSFIINEFGQVIVPLKSGEYGDRLLVGEVDGVLFFENPLLSGEKIDLSDDSGLQVGDLWEKPYIGFKYHLSAASGIYYYDYNQDRAYYLMEQDKELIGKLRKIRRCGSVGFVVNHHGIVLTKIPEGEYDSENDEQWQPIYIGRINYNLWFKKEE